jgi:hypothetical protein
MTTITDVVDAQVGVRFPTPTLLSGDGAITPPTEGIGYYAITKGSIAALTIAAPTAGARSAGGQDGIELVIWTETAFAHVITCASNGFNDKGASGTLTWTATKGLGTRLVARNGRWWAFPLTGVAAA